LVALVPSRDGDGTNALLISPPDAFAPSFGPGSFARHLAQAAQLGLTCRTLNLPGLGLDIDEPADLHELMRRTRADPRYAFLARYALLPAGANQR
jgi:2-phospho-L-lactate guanylyltransferase